MEWGPEGISMATHADYIHDFSYDLRKMLLMNIHNALNDNPLPDELTREVLRHARVRARHVI